MGADRAARAVNLRITQIACEARDGWHFDFLCECGCFGKVRLTVEEYLSRGEAHLPGHRERPVAA